MSEKPGTYSAYPPITVIGMNREDAMKYLRKYYNHLSCTNRVVSFEHQLRGIPRGSVVHLTPNWHKNINAEGIKKMFAMRELKTLLMLDQ